MPTIIELAAQFRAALEKQDEAALTRLIKAYGNIYQHLEAQIELLARDIVDGELTRGQVARLNRYTELIKQIKAELTRFQGFLGTEIGTVATDAIRAGEANSILLMSASADIAGISANFRRLPTNAIQQLLGFLEPTGPLYARIEALAGTNAANVANTVLNMVGIGKGPRQIASAIRDSLGGGLTDALRLTRTAQIYSYREANRANYVANSDVVTGWQWYAELGGNPPPCPSCIAMHGTIHPLNEALRDHHNGRCTPLPVVEGVAPVDATGRDWFSGLSESEQRSILGKGRFDVFKAGKLDFGSLSTTRNDEVYGEMRVVASLAELVS